MDRFTKNDRFAPTIRLGCVYGSSDSVPIDQSPILSSMFDPATGRPINDITCLLRAQNKLDAERILNSMTEFPLDFLPSDLSDVDALKYYAPRYAQMPSEMADLREAFTSRQLKEREEKEAASLREQMDKDYDDYLASLKEKVEKEKESKSD